MPTITEIKVETENRSGQKLVLYFTSKRKAWEFYLAAKNRDDVTEITYPDHTFKAFSNAQTAIDELNGWAT